MESESSRIVGDSSTSLLNSPELAEVCDVGLRSLLRGSGGYADVFAQEIEKSFVRGSLRLDKKVLPPIHWESGASEASGYAVRRLGPTPCFLASTGLEVDAIRSDFEEASDHSGMRLADPNFQTAPIANSGELPREWIREITDALISAVHECESIRIGVFEYGIRKTFRNSLGHHHFQSTKRTEIRIDLVTRNGPLGRTWTHWGEPESAGFDPLPFANDLATRANVPRDRLLKIPDRIALLLPAGWGGVWMHEAVGHMLEAGSGASRDVHPSACLGQRWSDAGVTVVDDGTLTPSRVGGAFDDEGVATRQTPLLENGIVTGILTDRVSATHFNLPLTGNGRRPHFGLPPRPRMTNLLLTEGHLSRDELLKTADAAAVVDSIDHAWLDAETGQLHLEITSAVLARNGEIEGHLPPLTASADPLTLLGNVVGVASDFAVDLDRGYCVKDGTAVPVTVGQPSVLIRDVSVQPFRPA